MIKLYCALCGRYCGRRDEILFRLERGAKVEISVTCRACSEGRCGVVDDLMSMLMGGANANHSKANRV